MGIKLGTLGMVFLLMMIAGLVQAPIAGALGSQPLASSTQQTTSNGVQQVDPNGYTQAQVNSIRMQMGAIERDVSQVAAQSLASGSAAFEGYSAPETPQFNSVFETFSFDHSLTAKLDSINVAYDVSFPNGTVGVLVITENPSVSQVTGSEMQHGLSATTYSTSWGGYSFEGANSGTIPHVYVADATWTVPAVTEASNDECFNVLCDLSVWQGITDSPTGSDNDIVQSGTISSIYCSIGCGVGSSSGSTYFAWYEYDTSSSSTLTQCSITVSSGDTIDGAVDSAAYDGGSSTSWTTSVVDTTTGHSCGTTETYTSWGTYPQWGNWIAETPYNPQTSADTPLPEFSSVTFSSDYICYTTGSSCSTPFPGIYTPYSNGYYDFITMANPASGSGTVNVTPGSVSTSSSFSDYWYSSTGT